MRGGYHKAMDMPTGFVTFSTRYVQSIEALRELETGQVAEMADTQSRIMKERFENQCRAYQLRKGIADSKKESESLQRLMADLKSLTSCRATLGLPS